MLAKIKAYMAAHPEIIFTGTGDCNQLAPIEVGCNNITNYKEYIENCMSQVFNKQIVLKICKRYKTDEDVKRVEALKSDIFDTDLSLLEIANKHFKKIENGYTNIHTLTNICYYKKTGLALCNDIHYCVGLKSPGPKSEDLDVCLFNGTLDLSRHLRCRLD